MTMAMKEWPKDSIKNTYKEKYGEDAVGRLVDYGQKTLVPFAYLWIFGDTDLDGDMENYREIIRGHLYPTGLDDLKNMPVDVIREILFLSVVADYTQAIKEAISDSENNGLSDVYAYNYEQSVDSDGFLRAVVNYFDEIAQAFPPSQIDHLNALDHAGFTRSVDY